MEGGCGETFAALPLCFSSTVQFFALGSFLAMRPSIAISVLALGALSVLVAYGLTFVDATAVAPWLLAAGATLVLTGLGLLGAGPRAPRLAAAVLIACTLTFGGFATALLLRPHEAGAALLFGLPRATTLMLICTGLVPLVLLPLAYAALFKREVLADE
jgi:hypothetical protein